MGRGHKENLRQRAPLNVLNLYLNYIAPKVTGCRGTDELNDKQVERNKEKVKMVVTPKLNNVRSPVKPARQGVSAILTPQKTLFEIFNEAAHENEPRPAVPSCHGRR